MSHTAGSSKFHRVRPDSETLLCPNLVVREQGTTMLLCTAEWRRLKLTDKDIDVHISARQLGTAWCQHLQTSTHTPCTLFYAKYAATAVDPESQRWRSQTSAHAVWFMPWCTFHRGCTWTTRMLLLIVDKKIDINITKTSS